MRTWPERGERARSRAECLACLPASLPLFRPCVRLRLVFPGRPIPRINRTAFLLTEHPESENETTRQGQARRAGLETSAGKRLAHSQDSTPTCE